jgi:hypothetical protein
MLNGSIKKWLVVAALLGSGLAMAQSEPTLNQVYEAVHAGKMEQAQTMMQQVLVAHPESGKAHYVQAELSARQGQMGRAREELARAEKLAPGLPFAKADAVQNLRSQLAARPSAEPMNRGTANPAPGTRSMAPASPASSIPWGLALALGGGAIALVIFLTRRKDQAVAQAQAYAQPAYAQGNGLSGPQTFGAGPMAGPAYGQPVYGQPAGSGLGGRVMGGLATGLAVGAGVMAAEAIGRNLMGNGDHSSHSPAAGNNDYAPFAGNNDMGGQDFGVADAGSWDDGGSDLASGGDMGGGWDS